MATEYEPGEQVPKSGIYQVTHDENHTAPHEVTAVYGHRFPPCNHCGDHPRFILVRAAIHVGAHKDFKD